MCITVLCGSVLLTVSATLIPILYTLLQLQALKPQALNPVVDSLCLEPRLRFRERQC